MALLIINSDTKFCTLIGVLRIVTYVLSETVWSELSSTLKMEALGLWTSKLF
jgi:hypothetical protein